MLKYISNICRNGGHPSGTCGPDVTIPPVLMNNLGWWLCYYCIYLFVYFPLFQRNGLHWDELFDTGGAAIEIYVAAGRWGLAVYRLLFEVGYVPWASGIVAGVYIATALIIQNKILGIASRMEKLTYGTIYLGCIQWATQLQFSHQSDAVALALLCMTSSVYLLTLKCRRCNMLSVCLIVYACSVYQTAMLYFLVLWMLKIMTAQTSVLTEWRHHVKILLIVFAAGSLYLLSNVIIKSLPIVSDSAIVCTSIFQNSMSKWGEIMAPAELHDKLDLLLVYIVCFTKVLIKNLLGLTYEGQWFFASALWPLFGLLWQYLCKQRDIIRAVLLLLVWTVPFAMIFALMTDQGARVSLAEPLSAAGIWALYLRNQKSTWVGRWCIVILGAVIVLKSEYRCAVIAEDEKNIYLSKMDNLKSLNTRIQTVAESAKLVSPDVIYFGLIPSQTYNPYVKRWNRRRSSENIMLLPSGRFPEELSVKMRKGREKETCMYGDFIKNMPIWPAPGSVAVCGQSVLVRFAE